ncbi:DUF3566 domain-containing protein [Corynebacterium terpenotabidum]|uniref:DUF3566 domain-containing protein n=1 Tax=Corynebacterium terpenotabidum Y-11 TaxID=1200352 RepID=S4XB36_9CORY|nr:DUF3566 domain-containing protein [Corynebacterium terpenotabidum]AGP29674.1 hypothetical protein A606_00080 [Corynebacterium terpenotabidum Y-11]
MTDDRRQVRTTLTSIDPRSAARIGAAVGACLFMAWMVAAVLLYVLLGATGVWGRVNSLAGDLLGSDGMSAGMFFGIAAVIGVLEVGVTVLSVPLAAVLYNAVAGYVGGLRISLGEGTVVEDADGGSGTSDAVDAVAESTAPETPAPVSGAGAAGWGVPSGKSTGGAHRAR